MKRGPTVPPAVRRGPVGFRRASPEAPQRLKQALVSFGVALAIKALTGGTQALVQRQNED